MYHFIYFLGTLKFKPWTANFKRQILSDTIDLSLILMLLLFWCQMKYQANDTTPFLFGRDEKSLSLQ